MQYGLEPIRDHVGDSDNEFQERVGQFVQRVVHVVEIGSEYPRASGDFGEVSGSLGNSHGPVKLPPLLVRLVFLHDQFPDHRRHVSVLVAEKRVVRGSPEEGEGRIFLAVSQKPKVSAPVRGDIQRRSSLL